MTTGESPTRYRFGPLERRGLVAGWRGGQIAAVAVALVVGVGVLARIGLTRRAWSWRWWRWRSASVWRRGRSRAGRRRSGRPTRSATPSPGRGRRRSGAGPFLRRCVSSGSTRSPASGSEVSPGTRRRLGVGVLHDRPGRTFTAVLAASDPGFVLLGEEDKVRRVSAWSGVLASLARDGSAVHRVQWVERVVPA